MHRSIFIMAAAALGLAAGTGAAGAQTFGNGSFYLKGFGGFAFLGDESANIRSGGARTGARFGVDYDTGYVLGAAGGYQLSPNMAVELEYAYRNADGDITVSEDGARDRDDGTTTANSVMVNALYTFTGIGDGRVKPYVGAGLGAAWVDIDGADSDALFAYQLIGGVGYEVTPVLTLYGEGRWMGANNGRYSDDGASFDTSFESVDVVFGARYAF